MKKIVALFLIITVSLGLCVGCGEKKDKKVETTTKNSIPKEVQNIKNSKVGDIVKFDLYGGVSVEGYPSSIDVFNDGKWIILDKKNDKALLLLNNPDFNMIYYGDEVSADIYGGDIQDLEGGYDESFIVTKVLQEIEKNRDEDSRKTASNIYNWVIKSTIDYPKYNSHKSRKKEKTKQMKAKFFLLSKGEVKKYLKNKKDRKIEKNCGWWLRSSCKDNKEYRCEAEVVDHWGDIGLDYATEAEENYVRPAMWIALSKEAKTE